MARKRKNNIDNYVASQYKNFHNKQTPQTKRSKTKRYFEHDTRTAGGGVDRNGGGSRSGVGGGGVKRIKFNNEISIYESNESRSISSAAVNVSVKKRSRNKSTKQLQKQLIETQKRLQRQLHELQQHQHNSFLALLCATECNKPNHLNCPKNHNNQCTTNPNDNKNQMRMANACTHFAANHSSHECNNYVTSSLSNKKFTHEKMANGINRSLIPCEVLHSNIELESKSCGKLVFESSCKSCAATSIAAQYCKPQRSSAKSTKPAIKSIILNTSSQPFDLPPSTIIKQEPLDDDEHEMNHINVPKSMKRIENSGIGTVHSRNSRNGAEFTKYNSTPSHYSTQLETKEMLGKTSAVATDYRLLARERNHSRRRSRQKSPGQRHSSRRKSKSADRSTRSRSSNSDRYSRRSSSRESSPRRSRSRRSTSRRSVSRSRSRSRHSRDTRSYGSTTSTSSSDSDRRSNSRYREQRGTSDSKRSIDYHETNSRGSQSKYRSKSPAAACDRKAFNYQNSIMFGSQRNNIRVKKPVVMPVKRFAGMPFGGNQGPETSKKFAMKPQPIVKLHSEPGTDSDDDGKIEREYEELLTFETNEDERREQRLLKALSDIAAKAKQKIQSITNESNVVNLPTVVNSIHHDVSVKTSNIKQNRNNVQTTSIDKSNDRRSTSYHNDDYSPKSKHLSRRSRKDEDVSTKSCKSPRSSRSPSIPRRRGSPSFLDRRRITSARKKPIPYQRAPTGKTDDEWNSSDKD